MNNINVKTIGAEQFSDLIEKKFQRKTQAIIKMIHHIMAEHGLTIDQLAVIMRVSTSTIYEWLSGANDLSLRDITKFENALGTDLMHYKRANNPQLMFLDTPARKKKKFAHAINIYKHTHDMTFKKEQRWLSKYLCLIEFIYENGHADFPTQSKSCSEMASWVQHNRRYYIDGTLDSGKKELLQLVGFKFILKPKKRTWNQMYHEVVKFKNEFGHAKVPKKYKKERLYRWLLSQRQLYWKGQLDPSKLMRLKKIGVDMRHQSLNLWEDKYEELLDFKEKNGHLHVCAAYGANKQLVQFVQNQRKDRKIIPKEHKKLLDEIGFVWTPGDSTSVLVNKKTGFKRWLVRFEELKVYKNEYGTSHISCKSKSHRSLGTWVLTQKQKLRQDKLDSKQIRLLEEIDFFKDNGIENIS